LLFAIITTVLIPPLAFWSLPSSPGTKEWKRSEHLERFKKKNKINTQYIMVDE
jgi:hypothetical protein